MKSHSYLILIIFLSLFIVEYTTAQTEIKGSGTTSSTNTLVTKNATPTTTMVVRDDGNVGIGTTSPNYKLEVNGIIFSANGGFTFPDGTNQTTAAVNTSYQQVYTVAQSGGDFSSIQNAINACGVTSPTNAFLIRVMPGVYQESVQCKKYTHLEGAGKYTTIINGSVTAADSMVIKDFRINQGIVCNGTSPTILNNYITNGSDMGHGIHINNSANPWIMENEIEGCNGWGILCEDFYTNAWIIANKIMRDTLGGIKCLHTSPTISNNQILHNKSFGILLDGGLGTPSEPTISDNVIAYTGYQQGGVGIFMVNYAEPRIIGNDIYINECGIWVDNNTQPSIIGNNINYNFEAGIRVFSQGAGKPVVIKSNHIHSNAGTGGWQPAGVFIQDANMILTHNNIHNNDRNSPPTLPDIDYSFSSNPTMNKMISFNVYDIIIKSLPAPAAGLYNVNSLGGTITP